jgi:tRNA A-37 threonylcarbamoyl transferase component Bud32
MSLANAQEIGEAVLELGLIKPDEWSHVWPAIAEKPPEAVFDTLQSRGLLTGLQIDKLRKGDSAGFTLGRFKLLYKISAGTFARVYRGVDMTNDAVVAIKVLRARHAMSPENVKQFQREAKLTEQLDHPNIVKTLDVGTEPETGQHYIAMEFVEGGNLRELLRIRKTFPPQEVVRLGIQMLEGLGYAFSRGVTHRDIKPTNVLFTTTGQIKWVDFGLAGITEAKGLTFGKLDDVQQQRTVDYAGLEKLTNAPKGDFRSDIFFLGNVFYMMLTGEGALPETRDRRERMQKSRFDAIVSLARNPTVPRPLAAIIDKMLAVKPDQRYQSYDDILRDLRAAEGRIATGEGVGLPDESGPSTDGFPPGPPRIMFIHEKEKLHGDVKAKLEKHGYATVCNSDLGRAFMLHDLKPFHAIVMDLASVGKAGVKAYVKAKNAAEIDDRKLAGVFLANSSREAELAADLVDDLSVTLEGRPVTLTQVKEALGKLLPGAAVGKEAAADAKA